MSAIFIIQTLNIFDKTLYISEYEKKNNIYLLMGNLVILERILDFPLGGGRPSWAPSTLLFCQFLQENPMESRKIWSAARIPLHTFNESRHSKTLQAERKRTMLECSLGLADSSAVYLVNKDYQIGLANTVNYKYGLGSF